MRTTQYACDWCQRPEPEERMRDIRATQVGKLFPLQLTAEICGDCFQAVLNTVQRLAVKAHDERELSKGAASGGESA